jgi:hypothetical protein
LLPARLFFAAARCARRAKPESVPLFAACDWMRAAAAGVIGVVVFF